MFPVDGEYVFQVKLFRTNTDAARGLQYPHELEMTLDGERIFLGVVGGDADFRALYQASTEASNAIDARLQVRVPVKAGTRTVGAAFLEKSLALDTRLLRPYVRSSADTYDFTGQPHLSTLTVTGPFGASGAISETPSRRRIFICRPAVAADEAPCARRILSRLADRAYRQPASADDLAPLLEFYQVGRRQGTFETGIQYALQRLLAGPKFVFRLERDRPAVVLTGTRGTAQPHAPYAVGGYELASRLSFFLWSSLPDDRTAAPGARGSAEGRRRARPAGAPHARGPASAGARGQLRRPVAAGAEPSEHRAELERVPGFRRQPAAARSSRRPSCSSRASSARIAASSI